MTSYHYSAVAPGGILYADGQMHTEMFNGPMLSDPLGIERQPTLVRKFAELLLYLPILTSVFMESLGIIQIRYAVGSIHLFSGVVGLSIILMHRERLPISFWFGLLFNLGANASQVLVNNELPVLGRGLPFLLFYLGELLLTWFVIQNSAAMRRVICFHVALILTLAIFGGVYQETHKTERLAFEGIGGGVGNPNTVANMAGMFSICLLFWSLRASKTVRPILWTFAIILFVVLLRTVSRTGIVLFFAALFLLILAIIGGKGTRIGGIFLIAFCLLIMSQFAYLVADQMLYIGRRIELKTAEGRLGIYSWHTVSDLIDTMPLGKGPNKSQMTATGITAHNSFVYNHRAYGGIAAWPYLIWLVILGIRTFRMARAKDLPLDQRFWIVALFGMAIGGELTNNINMVSHQSVFAWAMIEKYAAGPYRTRAIERREYETALAAYQPWPATAPG